MHGWHRASLKSICVPVSGHKRLALHESSSLSVGGFSAFFPLSVSLLPDSFVCCRPPLLPPSSPTNSVLLLITSDRFSHFPFPGGFISTTLPSVSLLFHPASLTPLFLFLSLLILSPGLPGCKWPTSRVV